MPNCLAPRIALQKEEGRKPIFVKNMDYEFWSKINDKSLRWKLLLLPCGKCSACQQNKSLEWTSRLVKEAEEWKYCYFLTFTYDDKHLNYIDSRGEVHIRDVNDKRFHKILKRDVQLFLKRFRKASGFEIKYYFSCEAGETTNRTHWHAIFFMNDKIEDLVFYANNLYTSELLFSNWQQGQVLLSSDVNERSIKYTIGYTLKKIGESKLTLMSKGLGLKYLTNRKDDIKFSNGFYLNDGFKVQPPSYFIRKLKESSDVDDIAWLEEYDNQITSSKKIDFTLEDMIKTMLREKSKMKGKGVF